MADTREFFKDLLGKGLPEALDGVLSPSKPNEQQFVERTPPQDTAARSELPPARNTIGGFGVGTILLIGGAVALVVALSNR